MLSTGQHPVNINNINRYREEVDEDRLSDWNRKYVLVIPNIIMDSWGIYKNYHQQLLL